MYAWILGGCSWPVLVDAFFGENPVYMVSHVTHIAEDRSPTLSETMALTKTDAHISQNSFAVQR